MMMSFLKGGLFRFRLLLLLLLLMFSAAGFVVCCCLIRSESEERSEEGVFRLEWSSGWVKP